MVHWLPDLYLKLKVQETNKDLSNEVEEFILPHRGAALACSKFSFDPNLSFLDHKEKGEELSSHR